MPWLAPGVAHRARRALTVADLDHRTLKARGGLPRALARFGRDALAALLDELNATLAA